jgi:lysine 6-dehydrogenase
MSRVVVLGAGRQGMACAYDLVHGNPAVPVTLADVDLPPLPEPLRRALDDGRLGTRRVDARDRAAVAALIRGHDAVACALPHTFNVQVARIAVSAGAHHCDLGGNTAAVFEQMELDAEARAASVSVIPDCGLAPGLVTVLASEGVRRVGAARAVRMYVGGLPARPRPPLNYQTVYSLGGVLDYYTTPAIVVRRGRRQEVDALSEVEEVDFGPPVGRLEAFHTAGGASTLPWTWEGRVETLEYKTLRYPGHAVIMRAIRDLGLLAEETIDVRGTPIAPRDLFIRVVEPRLRLPAEPDLVVLQVAVEGGGEAPASVAWRLLATPDETTGFSAMARVTGFSLAITCRLQLDGKVAGPGVSTPDQAVPALAYLKALARRGLDVREVRPTS